MPENLEIEFKTLVSRKKFKEALSYFQIGERDFFTQANHYFDTPNFQLKQRHMGLRIRLMENNAELTLKVPQTVGLLEITDILAIQDAKKYVNDKKLPSFGNVYQKLRELGIQKEKLGLIGSLTTKRAEKKLSEGLLALDESWYNEQHDFELELEVKEAVKGKKDFLSLLHTLTIPETPSPNKIQRMMLSLPKYKNNSFL